MDQEGQPLTQESIAKVYGEINAKYYANVIQDEQIAYGWARIPHFYMNYYVFQYATGMAAATALSDKILHGTPERFRNLLKLLTCRTQRRSNRSNEKSRRRHDEKTTYTTHSTYSNNVYLN